MGNGQRAQRLGRHAPPVGQDRQFAPLARDDLARDSDKVAQVDQPLPRLQRFGAHVIEREHGLQLRSAALAERGETQLSGVAKEHDATDDRDPVAGGGVRGEIAVGFPKLRQGVGARHLDWVGVDASGQESLALVPPYPHLLGQILFGYGGCATDPTRCDLLLRIGLLLRDLCRSLLNVRSRVARLSPPAA